MSSKKVELIIRLDFSEAEVKTKRLVELLKEARSLADEIASHELVSTIMPKGKENTTTENSDVDFRIVSGIENTKVIQNSKTIQFTVAQNHQI